MSNELTGPMLDNGHNSYNAGSGNSSTPTGPQRRLNGNGGAGSDAGNGGHPTHYDQLPPAVSPSYEPRKMTRNTSADMEHIVDMDTYGDYNDATSIPKMRRFSTTGLTPSDEKMMATLLEKLEHVSTSLPGPEATTEYHRKWSPLVLQPKSALTRWWVNYMHNPLIPPVEVSAEVQALPEKDLVMRMTVNFMRKLLAECTGGFIGTFWAGSIRILALTGNTNLTGVTLQIAGMIIAIIYAMAHISGGHYNTAVTWMFTIKGIFPLKWMWSYMAAQFAGGLLAGGFLMAMWGDTSGALSVNHWTPDVVPAYTVHGYNAMFMEAITFFLLGLVVLMCLKQIEKVGLVFPIIVGWTLISMGQINGVYTGWSSNPIRTLGPCLVFGNCYSDGVWVFVAGPLLGATVVVPFVWLLDHKNRLCEKVACCGGAVSPMY